MNNQEKLVMAGLGCLAVVVGGVFWALRKKTKTTKKVMVDRSNNRDETDYVEMDAKGYEILLKDVTKRHLEITAKKRSKQGFNHVEETLAAISLAHSRDGGGPASIQAFNSHLAILSSAKKDEGQEWRREVYVRGLVLAANRFKNGKNQDAHLLIDTLCMISEDDKIDYSLKYLCGVIERYAISLKDDPSLVHLVRKEISHQNKTQSFLAH